MKGQAMKRNFGLAILLAVGVARAQFPVHDMDRFSLGLGYTLAFRGEDITKAAVPSHEVIHVVSIAYAPAPYIAFQAGVGFDRFSVEPYQQTEFKGSYGFSPAFGVSLFSPGLLSDMLRIGAGAQFLYLNSSDARGYRYSGFITNPFLGFIVSPSSFLDVSAGARMHFINGTMESPHAAADQPFSNKEAYRGYLAVTLKTPFEGTFMTLDADMSPDVAADWSDGPRETTLGVSFGVLLDWKSKGNPNGEKSKYFPAYSEMKEKEKKMAEDIQ
jgi:hypothetical protein